MSAIQAPQEVGGETSKKMKGAPFIFGVTAQQKNHPPHFLFLTHTHYHPD